MTGELQSFFYSHGGDSEDSVLLDVTLCCWVNTSGILKNHIAFNLRRSNSTRTFYYPDLQMHNIYTNNILYILVASTAACFNASASSSGSLNLVLC